MTVHPEMPDCRYSRYRIFTYFHGKLGLLDHIPSLLNLFEASIEATKPIPFLGGEKY